MYFTKCWTNSLKSLHKPLIPFYIIKTLKTNFRNKRLWPHHFILTCTQLDTGKVSHRSLVGQSNRFALRADSQSVLTFTQRAWHGFILLSSSELHSGTATRHMSVATSGEQALSTIWPISRRLKPGAPLGWRVVVYPTPRQKLAVTGLQFVLSSLQLCACWRVSSKPKTTNNKCFMALSNLKNCSVLFSKAFGSLRPVCLYCSA